MRSQSRWKYRGLRSEAETGDATPARPPHSVFGASRSNGWGPVELETPGVLADAGQWRQNGTLAADQYDAARNRGLHMTSTEALDYAVDTLATGSA